MTHITDTQMEAFCARAGNGSGMESITEHLVECVSCQALFQKTLKKRHEDGPISLSLHPGDWFRLEHLGYNQLESFAHGKGEATERTVITLHLTHCSLCRENLRGYYKLNNLPVPGPLFVTGPVAGAPSLPAAAPVPTMPAVEPKVAAPPAPPPIRTTTPIQKNSSTKHLKTEKVAKPAPVAVAEAVITPASPPTAIAVEAIVSTATTPVPPVSLPETLVSAASVPSVEEIRTEIAHSKPHEQSSELAVQSYSTPRHSGGQGKAAFIMATVLVVCVGMIGAALFSWSGLLARQLTGDVKSAATRSESSPSNPVSSGSNAQPANAGAFELKDGERNFQVDAAGNIIGIEGFPADTQASIREALSAGSLKRPAILNELAGGQIAQSGGLAINYPKRVVILEDKPVFRWSPMKDAAGYQLQVNDLDGTRVAESGPLPQTAMQWTPLEPLKRGVIYSWTLTATIHGNESAPYVDAEARFKILDRAKLGEYSALKSPPPSHLALGVFYAREGLLIDARRELQALGRENPGATLPEQLIRSLQGRK